MRLMIMPPRRLFSPKTLEELCLNEIVHYLGRECLFCDQVKRYEESSLLLRRRGINSQILERELETYLDVLPPLLNETVRQYVTDQVVKGKLKSFVLQPEVNVHLLAVVLNKDVKTLEIGDETHVHYKSPIWQIIMKKCTGLRRFAMPVVTTQKMVGIQGVLHLQPFLQKVVSNCPTLTELILKDFVQEHETLRIIGRNCFNLKLLDITGSLVNCVELSHLLVYSPRSRNINIEGLIDDIIELPSNPLCSSLEVLILVDTHVKVRGAALAIKMLPNLITLGNFIYLPAALKRLYGVKLKPPLGLNITQAMYHGPSHKKLKALSNCCPKLEALTIGYDKIRRVFPSCFPYEHLRSLMLENVEFETFLTCTTILPQLVELKLSTVGIDVVLLGQHCINLEKLWLSGELLRVPSRLTINYSPFAKLKKLKVQCITSSECVGHIVKHAHALKVIDVVRVKELTDAIFAEWFQWNRLQHLETLLIRFAELTRASVDLLFENCPHLIRLGELGGWDIRSWEYRRLNDLVLRENYKLSLLLYSQNADSIIIDILADDTSSGEELPLL